jgi:ferredoxin
MSERSEPVITASVSHDKCVGVGMCVQYAPEGFDFEDSGLSVFQPGGTWTEESLIQAAHSCPTSAITVFRDGAALS